MQARPAIFNKHITTSCKSAPREDKEDKFALMKSEVEKKIGSILVPRIEPLAKASCQTSMHQLFASAPREDEMHTRKHPMDIL
jgi:hypothetical protein